MVGRLPREDDLLEMVDHGLQDCCLVVSEVAVHNSLQGSPEVPLPIEAGPLSCKLLSEEQSPRPTCRGLIEKRKHSDHVPE